MYISINKKNELESTFIEIANLRKEINIGRVVYRHLFMHSAMAILPTWIVPTAPVV